MGGLDWQESPEGVTFLVKVVPRARRDEIIGVEGGALKVRVNAPPVGGKANEALVKLLAGTFGVRRSDIEIRRGAASRLKAVRVRGLGGSAMAQLLEMLGRIV